MLPQQRRKIDEKVHNKRLLIGSMNTQSGKRWCMQFKPCQQKEMATKEGVNLLALTKFMVCLFGVFWIKNYFFIEKINFYIFG